MDRGAADGFALAAGATAGGAGHRDYERAVEAAIRNSGAATWFHCCLVSWWQGRKGAMHVVAVLNQKGGVGKSVISTNLAALAHLEGQNALVVDLDAQANAFDWYAARSEESAISGLVVHKADRPLSVPQLRRLVGEGRDFVVLDGAPYAGEMSISGAVAADIVVVPLCPGGDIWATAKAMKKVFAQADAIREQLGRDPARRVFVLNRVKGQGTRTSEAVTRAMEAEGYSVDLELHDHTVLAEAFLAGESIFTYSPRSDAADELRQLYRLVASSSSAKKSKRRE